MEKGAVDLYFPVQANGALYQHVVRQIEELILAKQLKPGDKLPSERELARQFEVSRTVIREAIKTLQQSGWVEARQGKGIFITQPKPQLVTDSIDRILGKENILMGHLIDAREMLEMAIICKAVQHINESQLHTLVSFIDKMDHSYERVEEYILNDHRFHMTLAESAGNPIYLVFMNSILELIQKKRTHLVYHSPSSMRRAQEHHRHIYEALKKKNDKEAVIALQGHFHQIREDIEGIKGKGLF